MKKALIVGINYPGTSSALRGCVNDAIAMNSVIRTHFGFTNIKMLLDNDATTANILYDLNDLVRGAKPGDTLFFHYSGHGSQVLDRSGEEADGLDEIICPVDLNWRDKMITDDMLKSIFDTLPVGVNLTVVLDCCNSGGALDQENQFQAITDKVVQDKEAAGGRFLPPPAFAVEGIKTTKLAFKPKLIQSRNVDQTGLLLTGCRSDQTSADAYINGKYQGAFTYSLIKALAASDHHISHVDLITQSNEFMLAAGFTQRPELNGAISLFGTEFLTERDYIEADLTVTTGLQPPVDPEEIEAVAVAFEEANKPEKSNKTLLIIGAVIAVAAVIGFVVL